MKNKLALSMLVALAAGTTWYVAVAQESLSRPVSQTTRSFQETSTNPIPQDFRSNPSPTPAAGGSPFHLHSGAASPAETLRQELIELTAAAASLMDEEELQIEVERARLRATVMAADQRLDEIREQLTALTEIYPGTEASATAAAMLVIQAGDAADSVPAETSEDFGDAFSIPDEEAAEGSVDIDVDN